MKSKGASAKEDILTVMETVSAPGGTIRYVDQFVHHAPQDINYVFMSWRRLLIGRYDVVHFHWPEHLIRGSNKLKSLIKRTLFRILLSRLKAFKTPVVRTIHNLEPHTPLKDYERNLLEMLDKHVSSYVAMSECTPHKNGPTTIIPHAHFREPFSRLAKKTRVRGRVLLFGRIEPYKGALELLRVAKNISDPSVEIRIVGKPSTEMRQAIESELTKSQLGGARVTTELRWVEDHELIDEYTSADVIILPYLDAGNGNSGVALTALSLNRPILTPRSCIMEDLASTAGYEWVQMYDGDLNPQTITNSLNLVRKLDDNAQPNLQGRDWESVAHSYAEVFRKISSNEAQKQDK